MRVDRRTLKIRSETNQMTIKQKRQQREQRQRGVDWFIDSVAVFLLAALAANIAWGIVEALS